MSDDLTEADVRAMLERAEADEFFYSLESKVSVSALARSWLAQRADIERLTKQRDVETAGLCDHAEQVLALEAERDALQEIARKLAPVVEHDNGSWVICLYCDGFRSSSSTVPLTHAADCPIRQLAEMKP